MRATLPRHLGPMRCTGPEYSGRHRMSQLSGKSRIYMRTMKQHISLSLPNYSGRHRKSQLSGKSRIYMRTKKQHISVRSRGMLVKPGCPQKALLRRINSASQPSAAGRCTGLKYSVTRRRCTFPPTSPRRTENLLLAAHRRKLAEPMTRRPESAWKGTMPACSGIRGQCAVTPRLVLALDRHQWPPLPPSPLFALWRTLRLRRRGLLLLRSA